MEWILLRRFCGIHFSGVCETDSVERILLSGLCGQDSVEGILSQWVRRLQKRNFGSCIFCPSEFSGL